MPDVQDDHLVYRGVDSIEDPERVTTTDKTRTSVSSVICPAKGKSERMDVSGSIRATTEEAAVGLRS